MYDKQRTNALLPKILYIGLLVICVLIILMSGHSKKETPVQIDENAQKLQISVEYDPESDFTNIPPEELGGNYNNSITYLDLSDVQININGQPQKLEWAIRDGAITVDEIVAYARIDAKNGICREVYLSEHGLTRFTYCYDEYDLSIVYDVYETPDGCQHLIQDIELYRPNGHTQISHGYPDPDSPYNYYLDREDWGLNFSIIDVSNSNLTISCEKSKGQQIGDLHINMYCIFSNETEEWIQNIDSGNIDVAIDPTVLIQQNASTTVHLDWSNYFGELDAGDYVIKLWVSDEYDPSTVHPLMTNFYDEQIYYIDFSIK